MYANGEGVAKDYQQAVTWYRKAAEQGHAEAQNNLGVMYDNEQTPDATAKLSVGSFCKRCECSGGLPVGSQRTVTLNLVDCIASTVIKGKATRARQKATK